MPTCPSCPSTHHAHAHPPIMPNTPGWGGCIYSHTHELSNHPPHHHPHNHTQTHPMNPLTTYPMNLPTTHPMNPPKYMYSDRVTLWICLMGGWVVVHKVKYFNIVTVHGWVSICTHSINSPTTHPTMHPTTYTTTHTHPLNPPTTHPTTTHTITHPSTP